MRERAGAANAVINTWPQSRILNTFSLPDSLLLFFGLPPFTPIIFPPCLSAFVCLSRLSLSLKNTPTHTETHTHTHVHVSFRLHMHADRQTDSQTDRISHNKLSGTTHTCSRADTYMCSHSDTISYTPRIYTGILLKPWQPHPPSTSLQSIQRARVCVCTRVCVCVCVTDAIYTITMSGFKLVALVTELNVKIWVAFF